jgi:hypothetical protein
MIASIMRDDLAEDAGLAPPELKRQLTPVRTAAGNHTDRQRVVAGDRPGGHGAVRCPQQGPRISASVITCWYPLDVAVPDYQSLMAPVLRALADGQEQPISQLREKLGDQLDLTDEDLRATIPSGGLLFRSRVHWAVTYLYHAGRALRQHRSRWITP